MAISYIGSASGVSTATLPAHQAGDVLLLFAFRDGNATAPTPVADWTALGSQAGTTCAARLAYKVATSSAETVGFWTNATTVIVHVYRGADSAAPVGSVVSLAGATSNAVQFSGLTLSNTSGSSWVAALVGHRSTAPDLSVAPSGFVNRLLATDATDEAAGHDTNGGTTDFAGQTVTVGGGSTQGWVSFVAEILAAAAAGDIAGTASGSAGTAGTAAGSVGSGSGAPSVRQFKIIESTSNDGVECLTANLDLPTLAGSTLYAVARAAYDAQPFTASTFAIGAPAVPSNPSPAGDLFTRTEFINNPAVLVNCTQISGYRANVAAGITQVSDYWCNSSGGNRVFGNYRWLIVFEVTGVDPSPLIDSHSQIATVAAGTDNINAGSFTFDGAGIIVGVSNNESQTISAPFMPSAGSGSTSLATYATYNVGLGPFGRAAYRSVAAAGSASQPWSSVGSDEYFTHAIALRGAGGAPESRSGTASGTADTAGSASAAARVAATGSGSTATTGSSAATAQVTATTAGSADSTGSATGAVRLVAQASGGSDTTGAASGAVGGAAATASAAGSADSSGSAAAAVRIAGTGAAGADTSGSSAAAAAIAAAGAGSSTTTGNGTAAVPAAAVASGAADTTGSSTGAVLAAGSGAGSAAVTGSSSAGARIAGTVAGTADTAGSSAGTAPPPSGSIFASGTASTTGSAEGAARVQAAGTGASDTAGSSSAAARVGGVAAGSSAVAGDATAAARAAGSASGSADTGGTAQAAGPGAAGDAAASGSATVTGSGTGRVRAAAAAGGSADVDGAAAARVAARADAIGTADAGGAAAGAAGIRAQGTGTADTGGSARGGQGFIPDPDRVIPVSGRSRVFTAGARPLLRAAARPRLHVVPRG